MVGAKFMGSVLARRAMAVVRFVAAAGVAILVCNSTASGGTVLSFGGDGERGDYRGQMTYEYQPATGLGSLTLELTNLSNHANGGYLTGFVFNIAGDASARLTPNPTGVFYDVLGPEKASPYQPFEFGAALAKKKSTEGDFLSGGDPKRGLAVGQTGLFQFTVRGPDASTLNVHDFLTESRSAGDGSSAVFLARFMGFDDGGSDKVPGVPMVPLPPAAWAGMALLGTIGFLKVRRRIQTA